MNHVKRFLAIEIEVNRHCNLACSYCPNVHNKQSSVIKNIDKTIFKKIITEICRLNFKGRLSYHFYGEPLLNPHLEELVFYARQELHPKVRHIVFTNGLLLTKQRMLNLIKAGVSQFLITKHEGIEKIPIEEMSTNDKQRFSDYLIIRDHENLKKTNRAGILQTLTQAEFDFRMPCYIPSQSIYFTLEGEVLHCFEDYWRKHSCGNILQQSLDTIIRSSHFIEFIHNCKTGQRRKNDLCKFCTSDQIMVI